MSGSIIDVDKLQNEKFLKKDWVIFANGIKFMAIFGIDEEQIKTTTKHHNIMYRNQKTVFTYKECEIEIRLV